MEKVMKSDVLDETAESLSGMVKFDITDKTVLLDYSKVNVG